MKPEEGVDTPSIVEVTEATVREFRVKFTGADSYKAPVEVLAYGRLIGHWFPAGSLPPRISPRRPVPAKDGDRPGDPGVQSLRSGYRRQRPASSTPTAPSISEKQRQRDEWLRKLNSSRTKGSGY